MLKKIETHETRARKQRIRNTVIGAIIVFLMVFSTIGYVIVENNTVPTEGEKYGNYTFVKGDSGWETTLKSFSNKVLTTSYVPKEVLDVDSSVVDLFYFQDKTAYVVIRSQQDVQASIDIGRNLGTIFSRMQYACFKEEENSSFCLETNLPLKSCEDADFNNVIIIIDSKNLDNSTNPGYKFKDGCLTIKGEGSGIIKASDNFIFKLFKIIG